VRVARIFGVGGGRVLVMFGADDGWVLVIKERRERVMITAKSDQVTTSATGEEKE